MNIKKHLKKLIIGLALVSAFVVAAPLTSTAHDYIYYGPGYYSYPVYYSWSPGFSFGFVIR